MARPRTKLLDVVMVARALEWDSDTIRAHLVPVDEYVRGSGKVPYVKLGSRYKVPSWYLEEVLPPPPAPPAETSPPE